MAPPPSTDEWISAVDPSSPAATTAGAVPMLSEVHPVAPGSSIRSLHTKIVIYQNILSLLQDVCSKPMPSHSRNESSRTQATLDGHLASMGFDNVVSGVVASLQHRKVLLEFASKLHLENDSRLRVALHADDERLAASIVSILVSKSAQQTVLALEGNYAQDFLDVVQDTLNRGFLMAPDHSRHARRIVRKLSETCDKLPSSLFITGVTHRDEHPTFAGAFGDIYRATHENKIVALKHMRHFIQSSIPEIREIRLKLCREALVWQDLRHPHILPFLGIDRDSFPSSLCAVSPWMQHGTILRYLQDHGRGNLDKLLYEVAQGLEYLHSCGVVHGDLRGANILITESWTACLADFGLSVFANAATTSMHTSSARAGSLYWMAPELIDPGRFGCKFVRTKASDVFAYGCVCFELYSGQPPFGELSQAAALLRIVNGERPARPSCSPPMSDSLWQRINLYWAEKASIRPVTDIVVREMMFPPSTSGRPTKTLRRLPPIPTELIAVSPVASEPAPINSPPASSQLVFFPSPPPSSSLPSTSTSSSLPLYVSPQGSPPGYDPANAQRVELTPFKLAQMEKARELGPTRELDLGHIMKLVRNASSRTLLNQTVVLTEGIQSLFDKARQREITRHENFAKQLVDYSGAGRLRDQEAVWNRKGSGKESPEPMDPDEIITLPEFVKEAVPPHVLLNDEDGVDATPVAEGPPPQVPPKTPPRPRRPTLPWLRISPSLSSFRYQLGAKSASSIPLANKDETIVSAAPKSSSSPLHRRLRSASFKKLLGLQDSAVKSPLTESAEDVFTASATDLPRGLWHRLRSPVVVDADDSQSNLSFFAGRPSEYGILGITHDTPLRAYNTDEPSAPTIGPETANAELEALVDQAVPEQNQSTVSEADPTPRDEDMWRLYECKFGTTNATNLTEALARTPPESILENPAIEKLYKACLESQEVVFAQIPWASASAERSRAAKDSVVDSEKTTLDPPVLTWQEELLLDMLATNEALLASLSIYENLSRAAVRRKVEARRRARKKGNGARAGKASRSPGPPPEGAPPSVPHAHAQPIVVDERPQHGTRVRAIRDYDPEEISFSVGDIFRIVDTQGDWWTVEDAAGSAAVASSDYFCIVASEPPSLRSPRSSTGPSTSSERARSFSQEDIFEAIAEQAQMWKNEQLDESSGGVRPSGTFGDKARALYDYTADVNDPRELSFRQGEILDIADKQSDWWPARNASGLVGIAPSNYLRLII
ncbi:kinase-like protein [Favolaschia claudopus]|uniref:mitogen-activated protein kinase kinase kinase n=1 Tax=Favolaschia claudopus TaxID=2862362 RepID=A0AAW0BR48_9AGAR